jgi:hypothetical protein
MTTIKSVLEELATRGSKKEAINKLLDGPQNVYCTNASPSQPRINGIYKKSKNIKVSNSKISQKQSSNSLTRKSSSVRNHRGRKYVADDDAEVKQKYFGGTKVHEGNLSGYVYKEKDPRKYTSNNTSVNKAINYYSKMSKLFPRSKTNSKKRGAIILKGKDSRN